MGLDINYFYNLTPRQFTNIQKGWSDRRDAESKERMIYTRRLMFAFLQPYAKNLTEQKLWPFDWESESVLERSVEESDAMAKELEATIKRWEQRDKKRQAAAESDS